MVRSGPEATCVDDQPELGRLLAGSDPQSRSTTRTGLRPPPHRQRVSRPLPPGAEPWVRPGRPEPPSGGQQVCRLNSQREEIGDPRLLVDAHGGSSGAGVGGLQCPPLPCCRAGLQDLLSPGPGGPRQPSTPPRGPSETAWSQLRLAPQRPFPDSGAGPRGRASPARAVCVDRGSSMHRWETPTGFKDARVKSCASRPRGPRRVAL